jgi:hypothetical protein
VGWKTAPPSFCEQDPPFRGRSVCVSQTGGPRERGLFSLVKTARHRKGPLAYLYGELTNNKRIDNIQDEKVKAEVEKYAICNSSKTETGARICISPVRISGDASGVGSLLPLRSSLYAGVRANEPLDSIPAAEPDMVCFPKDADADSDDEDSSLFSETARRPCPGPFPPNAAFRGDFFLQNKSGNVGTLIDSASDASLPETDASDSSSPRPRYGFVPLDQLQPLSPGEEVTACYDELTEGGKGSSDGYKREGYTRPSCCISRISQAKKADAEIIRERRIAKERALEQATARDGRAKRRSKKL